MDRDRTTWKPQVALITGAGSGLGRQLALTLAAEGMAIAGLDLHAEGLQTLEQALLTQGRRFASAIADVTDLLALQSAARDLETRLGPADLLIASAGLGYETSGAAFDGAAFARLVQVNLLGVSNSIAAVLPGMLTRGRGHLVAISSLASFRGLPLMAAYCASKAGVNALMESLRLDVGPLGIRTTTVCPGWIRTPMTDQLDLKMAGLLEVGDAAARIAKAIRRHQNYVAFPGAARWPLSVISKLPARLSDWFVRRALRGVK